MAFLDGPAKALVLPTYDVEFVGSRVVSYLLDMCMHGRRLLKMFLVPLPQGPWCFPYVFPTAGNVPTLIAVYYATLLVLGVLVLRLHEELFDCSVSLEVNLYSILTTYLRKAFWYSFGVGDDHKSYTRFLPHWGASSLLVLRLWVSCCVLLLSLLLLACSLLALVWELLSCRLLLLLLSPRLLFIVFTLNPVDGPLGIFAFDQWFPKVF